MYPRRREGGIEVKGKGWMQTYWVCPEAGRPRSPGVPRTPSRFGSPGRTSSGAQGRSSPQGGSMRSLGMRALPAARLESDTDARTDDSGLTPAASHLEGARYLCDDAETPPAHPKPRSASDEPEAARGSDSCSAGAEPPDGPFPEVPSPDSRPSALKSAVAMAAAADTVAGVAATAAAAAAAQEEDPPSAAGLASPRDTPMSSRKP